MSKYTTVRIDNETMKKLEYIVEFLQKDNIGKISKAIAIKHIVGERYEDITTTKSNT